MRSSVKKDPEDGETSSAAPVRSIAASVQQYKTRRRRGSLRKVALLGRRAQSDSRRDAGRPLTVDTGRMVGELVQKLGPKPDASNKPNQADAGLDALGVGVDLPGSRRRHEGRPPEPSHTHTHTPTRIYSSTTDDEDMVRIGSRATTPSLSPESSLPESVFAGFLGGGSGGGRALGQRHSPFQQAKSPLSFGGSGIAIATSPLPPPHADEYADWDYSETQWWGWVVLTATWLVFVMGMGSCLGVWSWAWDVGTTPYAPPELEDDPTLPIVGYYPALIILTGVMAWVWVVVAWVGMKYFRHAKISGD